MNNENLSEENLEYLKGRLERLGWEQLIPQLEENIRKEVPKFELQTTGIAEGEGLLIPNFELMFNKHNEHQYYYFNRINVKLLDGDEVIATASFRESWHLMPDEMARIMEYGDKVAVYKENIKNDAGEPFNAWITVNVNQPVDENGHMNLNTYHDKYYRKYPFDLDASIGRLPAQIKEQIKDKHEEVKTYLKHGIPYAVQVETASGMVDGCLSANAKVGRIEVLDENMEPAKLAGRKEVKQAPAGDTSPPVETEKQDTGEKKKFNQQPIRGNQFRKNNNKGMSM